ncbi:hypothetical protein GGR33_003541 [Methylobacterium brachythecii]|uniref:DUF4089 domain-containing protein n=1 Tax=Methylobacterium brachythecii TaxID=1176177 RepID=A0A7W6F820_9HYPH|nr:hypothetical protein [Methylobacterium brachythecii]GLS42768.1 hypothetical protein GCM10007884_07530 [Methylobacterium brachythecii]
MPTETRPEFDPEAYLQAGLGLLDLTIEPNWAPAIVANLKVLQAAAALVGGFALPDEAEAAPVYEA